MNESAIDINVVTSRGDFTLESFRIEFRSEIREGAGGANDGRQPDFRENVFTQIMLDYLAEHDVADGATVCHYTTETIRGGQVKINAWKYDADDGQVSLCISLFDDSEKPRSLTKKEVDEVFEQAKRFLRLALDGHHKKMEPSAEACKAMQLLYDSAKCISNVEIILFTDGTLPEKFSFTSNKDDTAHSFRYDAWDLTRLYRIISPELENEEAITIDFQDGLPVLSARRDADDHQVHLTLLPGIILADLYEKYGSRLLDLNVRSFLQIRGKVNKGIRDTLRSDPRRFLAYNNGISATAEHVGIITRFDGIPVINSLTGFQVVNGGQTVASIHRARQVDKYDISGVMIQTKITQVKSEVIHELAPLISRYANSQNKVSDADFSSNDPFNIEIQRLSEKIWTPGERSRWFYERTRGQYQVERSRKGITTAKLKEFDHQCPSGQRFSKTDMAKYLQCWDQYPYIVARGAQKNFVFFMERIQKEYGRKWRPKEQFYKELIAKAILFRTADRIAKNQGISSYKANVVACLVSLLSRKIGKTINLIDIWNRQTPIDMIEEILANWSLPVHGLLVETAAGRNVTEWCKSEDSWKMLLAKAPNIPEALLGKISGSKIASLGVKDYRPTQNMSRIMKLNGSEWSRLSEWGKQNGKLEDWQCGIAITLAGYGNGGWAKKPSFKQMRCAIQILEIAEANGICSDSKSNEQDPFEVQKNLDKYRETHNYVVQNVAEDAANYRDAAEQGQPEGQYNLGRCYYYSLGVPEDYEVAVKWYLKSAEQGHSEAQYNLGWCYKHGLGVTKNYIEAAKWFLKAAAQGNSKAQYNLGLCYEDGLGVSQSDVEATKWLLKAAEQKHAGALNKLKNCTSQV